MTWCIYTPMAELKRTQVYLTGEELSALDRRQRGTGTDRSQLIRRAIDREYLGRARLSKADRLSVVRRAAGAWKGRTESGAQYVERLRSGRLGRLHARGRSEEHTSELQSRGHIVCRLLLEKNNSFAEVGLLTA